MNKGISGDDNSGDDMEWIGRLNQSIKYIENNIEGVIDYNEAAKIACCSTFHFQRMFSYIAGVTLGEYIRRRRMTKAAFELVNSDIRIMDLSLKYGYESPTAFNRAFQAIHNISPSAARKKGAKLKSYPKLVFTATVKGDSEMQYRIEDKKGFRIVGIKKEIETEIEKNFVIVPEFWKELMKTDLFSKICKLSNQIPYGILGVTVYQDQNNYHYYIASATDEHKPDGMVEHRIPASTWAIFECDPSPEAIQDLYRRFYTEWLPFSGYEYAETQDIEVYPMPDQSNKKVEVWFSVRESKK